MFKEEDPTAAAGGENKWQQGINAWLETQTDSRYHPPSDYCGSSNPININFVSPHDHDSNLPHNFSVEMKADSTSNITSLEFQIDGVKQISFTSPPYKYNVANLGNGVHKLKAVAKDGGGHESNREITVGAKTAWDYTPTTPTPSPSPSPLPTPTP